MVCADETIRFVSDTWWSLMRRARKHLWKRAHSRARWMRDVEYVSRDAMTKMTAWRSLLDVGGGLSDLRLAATWTDVLLLRLVTWL